MRISVITVVLNRRDKIAATLDSVLGQAWDDLETIVVDGQSTDGTQDVLRHYGRRIDRLLIEPARGIYQAMNLGVQAATGEWLIFMNAGDVFADRTVLQRVAGALYEGRPLVCGGFIMVWGAHAVTYTARPLGIGLIPSCHQAMLVRTESARRHPFDVSLRVGADYDQVCRIAPRAGDIVMTDVVIARVEGEGFSSSNQRLAHHDYRDIIARHYGRTRAWVWVHRDDGQNGGDRRAEADRPGKRDRLDPAPSRVKPTILILLRHFLSGYKAGGALRTIANVVEEMGDDLDFRIITSDRDLGDSEPYRNVVVGAWNSVGNAQVFYVSARHQTFAGLAAVIRDTPHQVLYINSYFDRSLVSHRCSAAQSAYCLDDRGSGASRRALRWKRRRGLDAFLTKNTWEKEAARLLEATAAACR